MLRAASRAKFWQLPALLYPVYIETGEHRHANLPVIKVRKLHEELRKLGLKVSGKRAELLERFTKAGQTDVQLRPNLLPITAQANAV